jgi:hypothetical protein
MTIAAQFTRGSKARQRAYRFAPFSIYTIMHHDTLKRIAEIGRSALLYEKKRWVTGHQLFVEARKQGQEMAVLYADASHCSKLLYWGRLEGVDVDVDGTRYTVADLTPLSRRKTQHLVLESSNQHIAEEFIRPYAIVHTPSFIVEPLDGLGADQARGSWVDTVCDRSKRNDAAATAGGITLFSFGYWGCGSATPALVDAIDEAESNRGYEPPLWVDVRISRSVRAAGFRERRFEDLLRSRYEWMPDLGNKRVEEGRKGIEIKDPTAVKVLLQRALDRPTRRVIFFCSCEYPAFCHRKVVGQLLLKHAKERKAQITVIEWPGEEPAAVLTLNASPATLRQIEREQKKSIPIPSSMAVGKAAALPWGTIACVRAGNEHANVLVGPASFNAAGAHLRVFPAESGTRANSRAFRKSFGFSSLK